MLIKRNFNQNLDVQKKTLEILEKKIYLASEILSKCLKNKGLVIWCGNGGSASDSMHLSAELIGRSKKKRKSLRSISLSADSSAITCISNDFGYENLFSRQKFSCIKRKSLSKPRWHRDIPYSFAWSLANS